MAKYVLIWTVEEKNGFYGSEYFQTYKGNLTPKVLKKIATDVLENVDSCYIYDKKGRRVANVYVFGEQVIIDVYRGHKHLMKGRHYLNWDLHKEAMVEVKKRVAMRKAALVKGVELC